MNTTKKYMDSEAVESLICVMTGKIRDLLEERDIQDPLMVGIRTGGVWLAERLHRKLELEEPWAPSTSPSTATTSPASA